VFGLLIIRESISIVRRDSKKSEIISIKEADTNKEKEKLFILGFSLQRASILKQYIHKIVDSLQQMFVNQLWLIILGPSCSPLLRADTRM